MPARTRQPRKPARSRCGTAPPPALAEDLRLRLRLHISETWSTLTRDLKHAVEAAADPKTESLPDCQGCIPIFVSALEDPEVIAARLAVILPPEDFARVRVERLPGAPEHITRHGLLYVPGRYVVPGGRFNELYGWDSYFIVQGLLRDGRSGLAQSVADQLLYEVEHYGAVLNCNRTYCLARSQPPLLSRLVRDVFSHTGEVAWLAAALPLLERFHAYWLTPPHFTAATGLSRYHALGEGPAPEVLGGELDAAGLNHYERVCIALRDHPRPEPWFPRMYDADAHCLTAEGYRNDRTVRESGFDLTHRFGFCGLAARDYLPVCLNSMLQVMETDIAEIRRLLGRTEESVQAWETAAARRTAAMQEHFWDPEAGFFFDWNLPDGTRTRFACAAGFIPLWAGWATAEQAEMLARKLPEFLAPGGLLASLETTGCQWDAPFTWAPLVQMAAQGFARYGHTAEAAEISCRFLRLAAAEFARTGQLFEKYDAVQCTSDVEGKIHFGYPTNETGFGWTNAVLADFIPQERLSADC